MLRVENLERRFGGLVAVRNCSFEIRAGRITGLIGPNGAGKTTCFNMIAGALPPTGGRVVFDGEDISSLATHEIFHRGIVRTFQIPHEFGKLTVLENLMVVPAAQTGEDLLQIWLRPRAVAAREREVRERAGDVLEFLSLAALRDQLAQNLSGGQKKLLELGRTMMADPRLVLLDEPGAGVNPTLLNRLAAMIRRLNEERGYTFCARQEAHWLDRYSSRTSRPAASGWHFRLHAAPAGGLVVDEESILGGESFPLTLDSRGLPDKVRQQWPHLAAYDALRLSKQDARDAEELLTGQLAIAVYDDLGLARRRHRAADPRRPRRRLRRCVRPRPSASPGTPALRSWRSGHRRRRTSTCCSAYRASPPTRGSNCAVRRRRVVGHRQTGLEGGDLPVRGRRLRPGRGRGRDQPGHRPVLAGADDGLLLVRSSSISTTRHCARRAGRTSASPTCASPRTRRSTSSTCATSRSAT